MKKNYLMAVCLFLVVMSGCGNKEQSSQQAEPVKVKVMTVVSSVRNETVRFSHPRRLRRVSQENRENRENRPLDSGADKKSSCVWAAYPLEYMLASKRKPFPRIRSGSSVGRAAD